MVDSYHIYHEHMVSTSRRVLFGTFATLPFLVLAIIGISVWMQSTNAEPNSVLLPLLNMFGAYMALMSVFWWHSEVHRHRQLLELIVAQ